MLTIGLIREGKIPSDNRVAFTPEQCKWLHEHKEVRIIVQHSPDRCYTDDEYIRAGIEVREDLSNCDILMGIKEVPVDMLIPGKTYFFFSHTKKLQPYNQRLLQAIIRKNITLVDYECLLHADDTRLLGFGFFAGIVGAHNGMLAYGNRTGTMHLKRVYQLADFDELIHTYFKLKIPQVRIAVTGSGRVAHGILEVMNLMGIRQVEPDEYMETPQFPYPVYVQLKGADLYRNKLTGKYDRNEFHSEPEKYECLFTSYISNTDIVMNGVYWTEEIPRLFSMKDFHSPAFKITTIADITDDQAGSVPCNLGDATIKNPVYGIDKQTGVKTSPYLPGSVDLMAVGNLPNELPKDASKYFGEQLIKFIIDGLIAGTCCVADDATIVKNGQLTEKFSFMQNYAEGKL